MEFSRQEYWSGFPCPPPGDLPDPEIEPASLTSPALQVYSLPAELPGMTFKALIPLYTSFPSLLLSSLFSLVVGCLDS